MSTTADGRFPEALMASSPAPVGRGTEIARLHEEVDRVRRGHSARVLLTGESGIGTTTVVDAFCAALEADDSAVVVRVAAEEPVPVPVGVARAFAVVEQLGRALDARRGDLGATAARSALALHEALVGLRRPDGDGPPDRLRPVVLVLHDLQHVDPASAVVLTDVLRRLQSGGMFVLATATDPGRSPASPPWWPRLFVPDPTAGDVPGAVETRTRTETVGGLQSPAVAALVASRRPASPLPGPVVAARLVAATGGHPVHLALLVRSLPDEVLAGVAPPPPARDLEGLVEVVLGGLPAASRRLLTALAVLGGTAPATTLERVAGEEIGPGDVDTAVRGGLVEPRPAGLRFLHRRVRDVVLAAAPTPEVARMHGRAAAVLGGRAALAHAVAGAAGRPDAATADAFAAAAHAESSDHDDAATRLLWAADLSATGPDREHRTTAAAVRLVRAGATRRLRALEPRLRVALGGAGRDLALGVLASESSEPEAHVLLQAALDDLDADPGVRALAAVRLGAEHLRRGRGMRAVDAAGRVPALTDDPRLREEAAVVTAHGRAQQWGPDAGLDALADHLAGAYGPEPAILTARLHLAAGRVEEAYAGLHEALHRVRGGSQTTTGRVVHLALAETAFRLGRYDEAEAEARVGATTADEPGGAWVGPAARALGASTAAVRGDPERAEILLERARGALGRSPNPFGAFIVALNGAMVAHLRGDLEQAYRLASGLVDGPVPAMLSAPTAPWRVLAADIAIDAGRVAAADEIVREWPVAGASLGFVLSRHRLIGRLAEKRGDVDGARTAYRAALDLVASAGSRADACPVEVAALHAAAGGLARRQGWPSAAEDLAAARRAFAALGAAPWVAAVDAEIDAGVPGVYRVPADDAPGSDGSRFDGSRFEGSRSDGSRSDEAPVPAVLPAARTAADDEPRPSLTPREHEVVRLVAQGLTSREVAAALHVTPKAITYHLGNVFSKLGVTSRRQLWGRSFD
ncbi:helix-turn-helix transcriptional regulator [Actinomycetospora atypica]|uniref:AAA family ATPase n=1 Tax=Actinomycetospora atypica TaxID=1290095 RepID=A0ABV9YK06_9PSEU